MSNDPTTPPAAPAPETTPAPAAPPAGAPPAAGPEKDWKAEHDRVLAEARKHEDRAKANADAARELKRLQEATQTDQERAVNEAKASARAEALAEVAAERVHNAVKLAAAGRPVDAEALLEHLDPAKFTTDDGRPDVAKITAFIDRIAPAPGDPPPPPPPTIPTGPRGTGEPTDIDSMSPAEYIAARKSGRIT